MFFLLPPSPPGLKGKGFWEREESGKHHTYRCKSFSRFPELTAWTLPWREFSGAMALGAITKTNGICKKPQEEIGQEQLQREETDPSPGSPPAQGRTSWPAKGTALLPMTKNGQVWDPKHVGSALERTAGALRFPMISIAWGQVKW